jgi:hypothetical protein
MKVLTLLVLLVQKYKYCRWWRFKRRGVGFRELVFSGTNVQMLTLVALK